jgi:Pyruvate/2-oxoacid:ferredoxin oxidoreductase delta subunit
MIIQKELCTKCKKCVAECHKSAISKDDAGNFVIDPELCNDCCDIFEIECIRVCEPKAITRKDGTVPEFDPTWRLRSGHLSWMVALMGERGSTGIFPVGEQDYDVFRQLIAAAFIDPDFMVRLVKSFDQNCIGCPRKQEAGHAEKQNRVDGIYFERLGVAPGTIMKFWDVIGLFEEKLSLPFIRRFHDERFVNWIRTFISPDAKMLTNTDS